MHAGQWRFMVDVQGFLHHLAEPCILVQRVDRNVYQGYRHDAQHGVGAGQGFVTQVAALFLEFDSLGSQHEMGKIHIELVGRHVGALGQEAQVAEITLIHDLGVVGPIDTVDLEGLGFINQVKQGREGVAETDAATTAVTDVVHPLEFVIECVLVPERVAFPVYGVPGRGFETAFSHGLFP